MKKDQKTVVKQGYIYPAKKGQEYVKGYNYFIVCMTGPFYIVDCLPAKKDGRTAPGYEVGVPVDVSRFYVTRGEKLEA
jgi:hypothetical protein